MFLEMPYNNFISVKLCNRVKKYIQICKYKYVLVGFDNCKVKDCAECDNVIFVFTRTWQIKVLKKSLVA